MFGNFDNDLQRNRAILALLVQIASVDQKISQHEESFIKAVADQLGVSSLELTEVFADPNAFILKPPPPERERMTILYYSLFTMRSDGRISASEEKLCYGIGLRLGFSENMTREMIDVMKRYLDKPLPDNLLLDIIKKHMN